MKRTAALLAALGFAVGVSAETPRFGEPQWLAEGVQSLRLADVLGDPGPEILLTDADDVVRIGQYQDSGWRWQSLTLPGSGGGVMPADIDGDGKAELVATAAPENVLVRDSEARFVPSTLPLAGSLRRDGRVLLADDINDDGITDLLIADDRRSRWWSRAAADQPLRPVVELPAATAAWSVDLDDDGGRDLVLETPDAGVLVLRRQKLGYAGEPVTLALEGPLRALLDMDGDGDQDLVSGAGAAGLRWWRNDGNLEFSPMTWPAALPAAGALAAADLDNDGIVDLIDLQAGRWLQGRDPRLGPAGEAASLPHGGIAAIADLDGNGFPDLLTLEGGRVALLLHAGNRNGWLGVHLQSKHYDSGRDARVVTVRRDGARAYARVDDGAAVIGLNGLRQIDMLAVYWPSGAISRIEIDATSRYHLVPERDPPAPDRAPRKAGSVHRFYLDGARECR